MKLLNDYFNIQKALFEYFGYQQDWVVIPLDDQVENEWFLIENEHGGGKVVYGPFLNMETIEAGEKIYSGSIYTQRFLPKWVYRGKDYTMVSVDTHTDGNKFLMIFDNKKEKNEAVLKSTYLENWGTFP